MNAFPILPLRAFAASREIKSSAYCARAIDVVTIIPHIVDKTTGVSQCQKA
jgi:hypothetical protein